MMQMTVAQMSLSVAPQWGQMLNRHRSQSRSGPWQEALAALSGTPGSQLLAAVNSYVNQARYVTDTRNWGQSDYWATPTELFQRGGDCEDYAIAKYLLLTELGVSSDNMRILVLRASGGIPQHSVLLVQTSNGSVILDNLRSAPYAYSQRTASAIAYAVNERGVFVALGNVTVAAR